jgi:hypothetical protein
LPQVTMKTMKTTKRRINHLRSKPRSRVIYPPLWGRLME